MLEEFVCIHGKTPSDLTSIVLAGVHGDEACGIEAFKQVLPNLKIEFGKVYFGYGNPKAIQEGKRFIEANLNRLFKPDALVSHEERQTYEYQRAQYIKRYLDQAGALLDIHASHSPVTQPFLIGEPKTAAISRYLPIDLIVSGFDDLQPGGTDSYMNRAGKMGLCVECGYLGNPQSTNVAMECLYAFLKARGHIQNDLKKRDDQKHIKIREIYKTQSDCFRLTKTFNDFEDVEAGQIIGKDGNEPIKASKAGVILFARDRDTRHIEAFTLGARID